MIGDIILQKRTGWVGWLVSIFTRSDYVHVGIDVGDGMVTHVDMWGKHTVPVVEWVKAGEIIVLTPKTPLSVSEQQFLRHCCENELVQGYALWEAIKSWFYKSPDDEKPIKKRYHCSSFVSAVYRAFGLDLVPNRADESTQPQDFLTSPYLCRKT
jgi:hypothetical protein